MHEKEGGGQRSRVNGSTWAGNLCMGQEDEGKNMKTHPSCKGALQRNVTGA